MTTGRSGDEQRVDLEELRGELGATVEELAHRADVPARMRARRDATLARAKALVVGSGPVVRDVATRSPGAVAAGAVTALLLLVLVLRRRH